MPFIRKKTRQIRLVVAPRTHKFAHGGAAAGLVGTATVFVLALCGQIGSLDLMNCVVVAVGIVMVLYLIRMIFINGQRGSALIAGREVHPIFALCMGAKLSSLAATVVAFAVDAAAWFIDPARAGYGLHAAVPVMFSTMIISMLANGAAQIWVISLAIQARLAQS